jgi:diguanylate cyclase (GGDEF)-like protein/PAS domain S-box-containing protein
MFFVVAFLFIRRTLRAQAAAEKTLAENEHLLRTVTDNLPVLISYTDSNEIVRFGNSTYRKWLNIDPIAAVGRPLIDMIGAKVYEERREQIRQAFEGHSVEFQAVSHDQDRVRHVQIVYLPDKRADGSVSGVFALTTDITAMKTIERQLEELARFDTLTGLPNRRQLEERLTEQRLFISREPQPYALVFLDIDHFKAINDTYGHGVGDGVLKQFAARLQASVRRTDVVARLAGDEFVILLKGLHRQQEANMIAEKILLTMGAQFEIENRVLSVTRSIGIAFVTQGSTRNKLFSPAQTRRFTWPRMRAEIASGS